MDSPHLSPSARVGISKVIKLALMALGVVVALQVVGLDLSALAVIGGTLGLGIGLGLQRIVSNFSPASSCWPTARSSPATW